jgi:hypothetical protein
MSHCVDISLFLASITLNVPPNERKLVNRTFLGYFKETYIFFFVKFLRREAFDENHPISASFKVEVTFGRL